MLKSEVLLRFHSISEFFPSVLSFRTKANGLKTPSKQLIIIDFKVLGYCSGYCCFGVPVGCMPIAKEFDYLDSCKAKKHRTKSMGYC